MKKIFGSSPASWANKDLPVLNQTLSPGLRFWDRSGGRGWAKFSQFFQKYSSGQISIFVMSSKTSVVQLSKMVRSIPSVKYRAFFVSLFIRHLFKLHNYINELPKTRQRRKEKQSSVQSPNKKTSNHPKNTQKNPKNTKKTKSPNKNTPKKETDDHLFKTPRGFSFLFISEGGS